MNEFFLKSDTDHVLFLHCRRIHSFSLSQVFDEWHASRHRGDASCRACDDSQPHELCYGQGGGGWVPSATSRCNCSTLTRMLRGGLRGPTIYTQKDST
jgi:hypothetical protein